SRSRDLSALSLHDALPILPVGDDIGFLPGTEEEKMLPWMGALEDNLEVLHLGAGRHDLASESGATDWNRQSTLEAIRSRIKVKSDRKSTRLNSSHVKISYA